MSTDGVDVGESMENHVEDGSKPGKHMSMTNHENNKNITEGHGLQHDENLLQMLLELQLQNEFLKSHFDGLRSFQSEEASEQKHGDAEEAKELHEKIESLNEELLVEKKTRGAAEEALKHLQAAYSEADSRAQELSAKFTEAQHNSDLEIKEHEEKYSELDAKFGRLHKRAKQRIQEVQKEKDDIEARFHEISETAKKASSQQSALQQDLERTRQQAKEALRVMDIERQRLKSENNKLRDNIEELRRSLKPKENALEALRQSLSEKEQMLENLRGLLQAADERRQASNAELSAKHQKIVENLEAQIADALSDRNKAAETISSMQVLLAQKESKIAEMGIASTGEVARLKAAVESVKGELLHLKHEQEKEKENWEAVSQSLKTKVEVTESNCIRTEIEAAKMRSQLESELSAQTRLLSTRDAELMTAMEEITRLESEFSSYKVRAHALLQKKDAEIADAKDSEQLNALEEALKEAEKEILLISEERDGAFQNHQDALANHEKDLEERDAALNDAKQHIQSIESKLDSAIAHHQSEKDAWEMNLQNVEETWRLRCESLKAAQNEVPLQHDPQMQSQLEELKQQIKRLKEEHDSFRHLADRMIEEKDNEISKLVDENKNLNRSLELRPLNDNHSTATQKHDASNFSTSLAEQQILLLARQQAQREEELAQSQRHILALQEEIEELEQENRLHNQQESVLKAELRNMERSQKREGVDMTYLKNVILKLLETGEVEVLLPVIGMLLQFSPEEVQKCQQAYQGSPDIPPGPANEGSGSTRSIFSRFSFS